MPLFKDTVALEACPTKTAESISYGVTFAVLAGLLIDNYSGIDYSERESQSLANIPAASILDQAPHLTSPQTTASQKDETSLLASTNLTQLDKPNLQTAQFHTSPPTWHAKLQPYQQFDEQAQQRNFSAIEWNHREDQVERPIEGQLVQLNLPSPAINFDYPLDIQDFIEADHSMELASIDLSDGQHIREIAVSGSKTSRLATRPNHIQRPQIPRPYRAQALQRPSLLLPPKIQALRP